MGHVLLADRVVLDFELAYGGVQVHRGSQNDAVHNQAEDAEPARFPRLVVVDEAQRLTGHALELPRHLHDDPDTRFGLLYVGGDGC
ncbi:hypothetical protein ACFQKB_19050 [Actinomadura yumaensis]|uniref:ATP-binding protein n=1 Tax=Actinomadura yumaensis TaxID=111807 RepID=A0ABW2CLR3_9ACTN